MWHEARRRERATQKLFSDHKKRAEKRREENRVDLKSLLQVNGVKLKVNIDHGTHKQAANSMVVWQGDQKTTIDRFDVRTTLSALPTEDRPQSRQNETDKRRPTILDANENEYMKKLLNYERYRLVIQNDLKKVSESTRLSLVDKKNLLLSDAKMRKLKNNWFGTSGETSNFNDHTVVKNSSSEGRPHGVSIGFDYNLTQSTEADDEAPQINLPSMIPDLDDNELELDLDIVDKIENDLEGNNDITSRFGLNCDEFNALIESTSSNAKEITLMLKQLRANSKKDSDIILHADAAKQQDYYGPALPPDMQKRRMSPIRRTPDKDSSIRHHTLRGSPSRKSRHEDQEKSQEEPTKDISHKDSRTTHIHPKQPEEKSSRNLSNTAPSCTAVSNTSATTIQKDTVQSSASNEAAPSRQPTIKINLKADKNGDRNELVDEEKAVAEEPVRRERRAATPLAYKRYSRTSRSISRERTHTSRRRSSRSSSSDSTRSRSYSSSLSGSSYDSYSRSSSRRRNRGRPRLRSRSPRYRDSHRKRNRRYRRDRR